MPTDETTPHHKTFFQRISHFLIIAAYLWLLMSVYTLHNAVLTSDWNLAAQLGTITVKALLFGKFVLIAEHLHLGRRAEHLPLIWPILIKAALFAIVIIGFEVLEKMLVEAIWPAHAASEADAFALTNPAQIASLTFMIFVALIPFFAVNELSRILGQERLRELFFKPRP
jgi:hypothetical protein